MNSVDVHKQSLIEWSVASRPIAGQTVSGDLHLVKPLEHGVLLAAVDGVGHGDEATLAAHSAVGILEKHSHESVVSLVKRCHRALIKTRGVVMTVALLHALENTITWLGVGNVEGRLLRADPTAGHRAESVLLRGGLLGLQLPALQASVVPVAPGDLLILATDGVYPGFDTGINLNSTTQQIADRILNLRFKGTDDALVLVARYLGMAHE
jgi:serine phosphatase RsbU (regulator of sigma subunit)